MRINSVVATTAHHAETTTDVAAQAEHPVAPATEHAHATSNPFAVLAAPLFRASVGFNHDQRYAASVSGSSESNPQQGAQRRGIIVIGGSQDHAAGASPTREAIQKAPALAGIIIVGGSTPGRASIAERQPKPDLNDLTSQDRMGNFEIQRLMSAFNQAETLASNMQKKLDDTISGQQQKIG
jgi:hypothetical protein